MAFGAKVATFTWNTADVAGTNYDITLGFQPTFVRLMSGQLQGIGVSSSNRRSVAYMDLSASATGNLFIRHSDVAILSFPDVTGAAGGADSDGDLDIAAEAGWPADGIRFTVDTQLNAALGNLTVAVVAVGGTDIVAANIVTFQEPGATGALAVAHGVGGVPTGAMFLSVGHATAPPIDNSAQGMLSVGYADGTGNGVLFVGADDANTTMDTRSYSKTGECVALGPEPAVTLNCRMSVTSFDGTNVNLDVIERASTRYIFMLVWRGGQFRVDSVTTATDTSNFAKTGYGFQPVLAEYLSACRVASTADTPTDHSMASFGAATGPAERATHSVWSQDGVGTSEGIGFQRTDAVYTNISTAEAVQGLMDLVSFDADGMTHVMDDADPTGSFVLVPAWGAAVVLARPPKAIVQLTAVHRAASW